jgi:hypothetical protein
MHDPRSIHNINYIFGANSTCFAYLKKRKREEDNDVLTVILFKEIEAIVNKMGKAHFDSVFAEKNIVSVSISLGKKVKKIIVIETMIAIIFEDNKIGCVFIDSLRQSTFNNEIIAFEEFKNVEVVKLSDFGGVLLLLDTDGNLWGTGENYKFLLDSSLQSSAKIIIKSFIRSNVKDFSLFEDGIIIQDKSDKVFILSSTNEKSSIFSKLRKRSNKEKLLGAGKKIAYSWNDLAILSKDGKLTIFDKNLKEVRKETGVKNVFSGLNNMAWVDKERRIKFLHSTKNIFCQYFDMNTLEDISSDLEDLVIVPAVRDYCFTFNPTIFERSLPFVSLMEI